MRRDSTNAALRARLLAVEPGKPVMAYDQDKWAVSLNYHDQDVDDALKLVKYARKTTHALLEILPDSAFENTVIHPEFDKPYSFEMWLSIYPEHIPDRFSPGKRTLSNYDYFTRRAGELGLSVLDLNRYFLQMKDTARFPLFPRYGMHWSLYGANLAAEKLSGHIAAVTGRQMPGFRSRSLQHSMQSIGTDYDIGEMLNLVCTLKPTPGVYPQVAFDSIPGGTLSALVVADSYYINMVETYGRKMFGKQDYWYYNSSLYPHQNDIPPVRLDKSGLREKLKNYDVVLLMVSEINLHCCFWNFADEAYLAFHPEKRDSQLDDIENTIRIDREWFRFMVKQSREQKRPLEEMITANAEYSFYGNFNNLPGKTFWDTIQYITMNIKANPKWLGQITKNAREQHMPVDTALMLNAIYSYNQSKKKQ